MRDYRKREENQKKRFGRMERKALICILGLILLLLLLSDRTRQPEPSSPGQPEPVQPPHVAVKQTLHNVWIMEAGEEELLLYRDGAQERYGYGVIRSGEESGAQTAMCLYQPEEGIREQVADVELTDGMVTGVRVKKQKIHGVILSADDSSVEVEGYGSLALAEDYRGYRIYNTLAMCTQRDLAFGYDFTDLVMEDGKICAILMVKEEAMDQIRVLVKTADFGGNLHEALVLTADSDFLIRYGEQEDVVEELHTALDEVEITRDSVYLKGGRAAVIPAALTGKILLKNVSRGQGTPAYRGHLELVAGEDGFAVVNVVSLEEYLYSVVPSEMPASYPREALKAQAICARTYAYSHIQHAAYPAFGAHLDDSTSYQVYNNIAEQESTTTAVKETYGQLLYTEQGRIAETYYYSTSCGVGSDANVWKTKEAEAIDHLKAKAIDPVALRSENPFEIGEYLRDEAHFAEFIRSVDPDDYESEEAWYRWTYRVRRLDPEQICGRLKQRYNANEKLVLTLEKGEYVSRVIEDFQKIYEICVASRLPGGVADELVLETDSGTYKVITEYNIRYVLCDGVTRVKRQKGKDADMPNLLPSAFFVIDTGKEDGNVIGYTLTGGGFGHGVGMSQNAAKSMADSGLTCEEILLFFYDRCSVHQAFGQEKE